MRARLAWVGVGAATTWLAWGCGPSTPEDAPLGSTFDGGTRQIDGAAHPDAGEAEAADGGDSGNAATGDADGGDAATDDVDAGPPLCAGKTWTTALPTSWITGVHRFGGVTPNELVVAWTSDASTIWVASRAALTDAFPMPYTSVSTEMSPQIADDRIALAPNGLTIVAVAADRSTFVAFSNEGGTWGSAPADQFVNLAAMASDSADQFFEPVLGADGNFYYLLAPVGTNAGPPVMYQSTWNGQQRAWNAGIAFTDPELTSTSATARRRPTGVPEDGRTLFFFDEIAGIERQATRDSSAGAFTAFADLPAFPEAAPGGLCERLYFVTGTGDSAAIASER